MKVEVAVLKSLCGLCGRKATVNQTAADNSVVEWSGRRTGHRQRSQEKWRPQQAYGSNQVLFAQPQTIFSTHKILTRTHRSENGAGRKEHTLSLQ